MKWKSLAGIGIGVLFLYFALRGIDLKNVAAVLMHINPDYIVALVVTILVNMWLRAARWQYMLRRDHTIPTYRLFKIIMIGFMANNVLPARLGEFVRAHTLGSRERVSRTYAFASIVLERMLDAFAIVFIMVGIYALSMITGIALPAWVAKSGFILTIIMAIMAIGLVILRFKVTLVTTSIVRILSFFIKKESIHTKIKHIISSFFEGLGLIQTVGDVFIVGAYSLGVWGTIILMCELAIRSLGISGLPVYASSVTTFLLVLGVMIPGAPGFVGTIQLVMIKALDMFGVAQVEALSVSVVYHVAQFIPITLIGLIYYWSGHISFKHVADKQET